MNIQLIAKTAIFATASVIALSTAADASPLFSDGFNDYRPGGQYTQIGTGLAEGAFGSLGQWDAFGANAVHAVDRTGTGNWAAMLYGGPQGPNRVVTKTAFAANGLGSIYSVKFESAAAAYGSDAEGTSTGDILQFDLQRADGSSLFTYIYDPADWTGGPNNPFTLSAFNYTGDGSGDLKLSILGLSTTFSNRFGGAVDNVSVDLEPAAAVPEPALLGLFGLGAAGLGLSRRRRAA